VVAMRGAASGREGAEDMRVPKALQPWRESEANSAS
jgi:hypothetical protein